jgi:carbamoyl-phosphate synthase small subunit
MSAYVLLEDGTRFDGEAVGRRGSVTGEVVFTTGMSGYQESMTDPSFARQLITFTTAHVGNYGVSEQAMESDRIHAAGAIMRHATDYAEAPGAEGGWLSWLAKNGIPGIDGVDTRALVRHIRSEGSMRGGIFQADVPQSEARERIDAEPSMVGRDLAREVTTAVPVRYEGEGDGPRIVALDTGIKRSIIRNFTSRGATLEIYPLHDLRRGPAGHRPGRLLPRARPRRPGGAGLHRREHPHAAVHQAGVRHLPRPPAPQPCGGP